MSYSEIKDKLIRKKSVLILFLILLIGLSVRIYRLQGESLYIDEALDAIQSTDTVPGLVRYFLSVAHFPTYFIMMHYWIKLCGLGEFALRFPSAIFGVLSVYLVFLLGRKLFSETAGFIASYLFAVSPINIFYSQFFSAYNTASSFVLLSFLFFYKALDKNTRLSWFLYMIFTLFAILLSLTVLPILICQLLLVIFLWLKYGEDVKLKKILLAFTAISVIYLPVLSILLFSKMKNSLFYPVSHVTLPPLNVITDILNLFGGKIFQSIIGQSLGKNHYSDILVSVFRLTLFLLFLIGTFGFHSSGRKVNVYQKKREFTSVLLLFLWFSIPFVFSCIKVFDSSFGAVRYVLHTSAAYYLLISQGIMQFKGKIRILLSVCIVLFGLLFLKEYYRVEKRTNWRQICSYLKNNIRGDEKIAFIVNNSIPISYAEYTMLTYYSVLPIVGIRADQPSGMSKEKLREYEDTLKFIETHTPKDIKYKGIWLATWGLPSLGRLQFFTIEQLKRKYILLEEEVFYDVSLHHFRMEN